jgi:aspartyl-tRNA(Asn)/glutamyl-tRNA(Gln) amidotransferase subunit A
MAYCRCRQASTRSDRSRGALLDAVLSGSAEDVPTPAALGGLRLAVPTTLALDGMDDTVASAFEAALRVLSKAGVRITELAVPEFASLSAINAKGGFAAAEAWHWHRHLIERMGSRYDPRVRLRIQRGAAISAADYMELLAARTAWIRSVEARLDPFDALVLPTVPVVAPPIAQLIADDEAFGSMNLLLLRNPTLINFLDGCALSLPCQPVGTAPVGLMIACPRDQDRRVLAIGLAAEAHVSPPRR